MMDGQRKRRFMVLNPRNEKQFKCRAPAGKLSRIAAGAQGSSQFRKADEDWKKGLFFEEHIDRTFTKGRSRTVWPNIE